MSIVSSRGRPVLVGLPLTDDLLKNGVGVALAAKLYQDQVLGLAAAAKISGQPKASFIKVVAAMGVAVVDYPADEVDHELRILDLPVADK